MIEDFRENKVRSSFGGIVAAVVEPAFLQWLDRVRFCNTLVDRIVPGAPRRELSWAEADRYATAAAISG